MVSAVAIDPVKIVSQCSRGFHGSRFDDRAHRYIYRSVGMRLSTIGLSSTVRQALELVGPLMNAAVIDFEKVV
jgi:hypothetical protein